MGVRKLQNKFQNLVHMSSTSIETAAKSIIGFAGSITAASINTWIGIIAGLLTCVYMGFQIESAWRKRKRDKNVE